jgi:F-type H+-transporting ATPase subunit a
MDGGIHISLAAETLGTFLGIPITNTLLTSWIVIAGLMLFAFLLRRKLALIPGKLQLLVEMMVEYVLNYMEETLGTRELALRYLPLILTIFIFILFANIIEFLPGFGSIGFFHHGAHGEEFIPLFRAATTDLNVTLALAAISFIVIEVSGILILGFLKYFSRFVNVKSGIGFMVGIIDIFSELARLISFSFRLFGNIFAGEVMILVITAFIPIALPVPLMLFEMFVGFIQAAIFAMLTLFFIKIAISEHEEEGEHAH